MRLAVLEDDAQNREALAAAVRKADPACSVELHDRDAQALVDLAAAPPDLALFDLSLAGMLAIDTIRELRTALPALPVLVLVVPEVESPALVLAALAAGVTGCLRKSASPETLRVALRSRRTTNRDRSFGLTDRELDVLALLVAGKAYGEISAALDIGVGTVQSHVRNIYRKLGVTSKTAAAMVAVRHGLVARKR